MDELLYPLHVVFFRKECSIFLNGRNRILNYMENYDFLLPDYYYNSRSISIACITLERVIIPHSFYLGLRFIVL